MKKPIFTALAVSLLVAPAAFAAPAAAPTPAAAPAPVAALGPTLAQSLALAEAALNDCKTRGYAGSASVVDSAGMLKVTIRADGAPKDPIAAPRKAATAVAFDAPGSELQPREAIDPAFKAQMAAHATMYNDHPGSLPLHANGILVGGLAVADVPHDVADLCVRAALAKYPLN